MGGQGHCWKKKRMPRSPATVGQGGEGKGAMVRLERLGWVVVRLICQSSRSRNSLHQQICLLECHEETHPSRGETHSPEMGLGSGSLRDHYEPEGQKKWMRATERGAAFSFFSRVTGAWVHNDETTPSKIETQQSKPIPRFVLNACETNLIQQCGSTAAKRSFNFFPQKQRDRQGRKIEQGEGLIFQ